MNISFAKFPISILIAITLLGAWLRVADLDRMTIAHIEMYTPGIDLPRGLSSPEPRLNLRDTFTGLFVDEEPNPPGYYFLMLGWTKIFGASIIALRLPSVLFGIASILLVYKIGALENNLWAGILAAGMVALNGQQILWSQFSKMYALGCALGLLSTWLLLMMARPGAWQRVYQILYIAITLAGLTSVVSFWFLLAAQIFWALRNTISKTDAMPGVLRLQLFITILATPLLSLAIFQSRRASYLDTNPLPDLAQFFQFAYLFEPDTLAEPPRALPFVFAILLLTLTLTLIGFSFSAKTKSPEPRDVSVPFLHWIVMGATALAACLVILRLAQFTQGIDAARTNLVLISSALPLLLFLADIILRRSWSAGVRAFGGIAKIDLWLNRIPNSASLFLALIPIALIVALTPVAALFAGRTVLLFAPYLFLAVSAGLVALIQKNKWTGLLIPFLFVAFLASALYYKTGAFEQPNDYKGLAEKWTPVLQSSDLIFVQRHWATTPIFYYVQAGQYQIIGDDYARARRDHPQARVWVFELEDLPLAPEIVQAVQPLTAQQTLAAQRTRAILYTR
ncbi:MAG: glycosyltransferase family 39 protein [Chloroflexi bacterium]|nr:glycosyltransferase family 39 protein [Chloroflexota bacterium]